MTGVEQLAVWLFGMFCGAVSVTSVARSWSAARVNVAREYARMHLEVNRAAIEAQHGPHFVPPAWTKGGEA